MKDGEDLKEFVVKGLRRALFVVRVFTIEMAYFSIRMVRGIALSERRVGYGTTVTPSSFSLLFASPVPRTCFIARRRRIPH